MHTADFLVGFNVNDTHHNVCIRINKAVVCQTWTVLELGVLLF